MKTWGIAVIGSGGIADFHIRAVQDLPNARLIGVFSRSEKRAKETGEKYNCDWTTNYEDLLHRTDVDVVIITTSSGSHARIGRQALEAGKHVLLEKPITMQVEEAKQLIGLAEEKGLLISVVSQRRFEPLLSKVKQIIAEGKLGRLLLLEANTPFFRTQAYYDSADWRGTRTEDGGALMNQGIHQIDLMLWYGGKVKTVYGKIGTYTHDIEAEDLGVGIVTFENGAIGRIMSSTSTRPGFAPSIYIYGEKGTVKIEGSTIVLWDVEGTEAPLQEEKGKGTGEADPLAFSNIYHKYQIIDVLRALDEGTAPSITAEDGLNAIAVVNGIYESSETGVEVKIS